MNINRHFNIGSNSISDRFSIATHTAFYHSYCVEASNPLTSFVDFRFKDRFFRKIVWRNSLFRFTKLISHSSFTIIRVNCALNSVNSLQLLFDSDYAIITMI